MVGRGFKTKLKRRRINQEKATKAAAAIGGSPKRERD